MIGSDQIIRSINELIEARRHFSRLPLVEPDDLLTHHRLVVLFAYLVHLPLAGGLEAGDLSD